MKLIENIIIDDYVKVPIDITELDISYCDLKSLKNIEYLQDLVKLNIVCNSIHNLSILKELKCLTHLYISYYDNMDMNFLYELKKIRIFKYTRLFKKCIKI